MKSANHIEEFNICTKHLESTINWLLHSIKKGNGGSCAYFGVIGGWSKDYPETTGYIIPTLIKYGQRVSEDTYLEIAKSLGDWLIDIQEDEGFWQGGFYPYKKFNPSVFNTGQILLGLSSLYEVTGDTKWIRAAEKGSYWLAKGVNNNGIWEKGNYTPFNPSYYTRVAWPMLEVAEILGNERIKKSALLVLDRILQDKSEYGTFKKWGFFEQKPAFTHTMAYTLRGFIEASMLMNDWERYGEKIEIALNKIYKLSELNNGRLAGAYGIDWSPVNYYSCLTGNVQMAICLMRWHQSIPDGDLRLVNAASKLISYVNKSQFQNKVFKSISGAVAGSRPIWGRYMIFRFPNWAAKFHADALMLLLDLIRSETNSWHIKE